MGYAIKRTSPYGLGQTTATPSGGAIAAGIAQTLIGAYVGLEVGKAQGRIDESRIDAERDLNLARAAASAAERDAILAAGGGMSLKTGKTIGLILGVFGVGLLATALVMKKKKRR